MTEPQTEAGRAFLDHFAPLARPDDPPVRVRSHLTRRVKMRDQILAIEAEAIGSLAALRAALERDHQLDGMGHTAAVPGCQWCAILADTRAAAEAHDAAILQPCLDALREKDIAAQEHDAEVRAAVPLGSFSKMVLLRIFDRTGDRPEIRTIIRDFLTDNGARPDVTALAAEPKP